MLSKEDINTHYINGSIGKIKNSSEEYDIDLTRYTIILPKGYSGHKLLDYLRSKKIQAEMSFSRGVVLILSPFNTEEDLKKIYEAILTLEMNDVIGKIESNYYCDIPVKKMEPYEVFNLKSEYCEVEMCEGYIAKEAIIPYPPGIPLVCPGEVISRNAVNIIQDYIINKKTIIGVSDNKLKVISGE